MLVWASISAFLRRLYQRSASTRLTERGWKAGSDLVASKAADLSCDRRLRTISTRSISDLSITNGPKVGVRPPVAFPKVLAPVDASEPDWRVVGPSSEGGRGRSEQGVGWQGAVEVRYRSRRKVIQVRYSGNSEKPNNSQYFDTVPHVLSG